MNLIWWLPTQGDGKYIGTTKGNRSNSLNYHKQIVTALDMLGYDSVLVPTGRSCEDPWIFASSLVNETKKLRYLIALRPSVQSPTLAGRLASSFDRISNGRLELNIVTGGVPAELHADGVHLEHSQRYKYTEEFLEIFNPIMEGKEIDFEGDHINVENANILFPSLQNPRPPIFFGGASDEAMEVAVKHSDVYLMWAEPFENIKNRIIKIKELELKYNRTVELGIRFHIIVRETEKEARKAAANLIKYASPQESINLLKKDYDSVGQSRLDEIMELHPDDFMEDNLWKGIGRYRGGASIAIVGDPQQVASTLFKYQSLGIKHFIISGYPNLEEIYNIHDLLFPLIKSKDNINISDSHLGNKVPWF
ncbi:alkanesulfonate monooxygenase [Bacillus cereus]|uniref:Alkanesulfonate monooxygenase n=1 Tax=Bacillus cereus TaxID=1396 RepID=A0A2B3TTY2_BACCE|nr:LLM class flavin-dependent oxidoreductase [Bacillus cereus]PFL25308.1 alkanesulfonate monooxygenase [Bacillus cereus]PFU37807.1 alkanesulfonate monooxygenase [Bacillus cereus]